MEKWVLEDGGSIRMWFEGRYEQVFHRALTSWGYPDGGKNKRFRALTETAPIDAVRALNTFDRAKTVLRKLVDDCTATDFNEHWESFKDAEFLLEEMEEHG